MNKVLMILRREYLAAVKTKMFWIGTLAIPFGMMALMGISMLAVLLNPEEQKPLAFLSQDAEMAAAVAEELSSRTLKDGRLEYPVEQFQTDGSIEEIDPELKQRVLDKDLYAVVLLGEELDAKGNFRIFRKTVGDPMPRERIRDAITDVVIGKRLANEDLDLSKERLDALTRSVRLDSFEVSVSGDSKRKSSGAAFIPSFMFMIILFATLYFYGYSMARGVIQEKSTRVMEVLLGSVSPEQLMAGKILGIGLVGLTQFGVYGVVGTVLRLLTIPAASGKATIPIPEGDAQEIVSGVMDAFSLGNMIYFVVFFLLGYFLFTAMFAIIGAVCTTEQDAQSLQFPVMMCLMIPYMMTFMFVRHPDSLMVTIASLIPVFTPMVMFLRITLVQPPFWQIALSIVLTLGATYLVMRIAAKVFRIGTLMYGKRPSIPEIVRWARS